jgi:hypothetical protein
VYGVVGDGWSTSTRALAGARPYVTCSHTITTSRCLAGLSLVLFPTPPPPPRASGSERQQDARSSFIDVPNSESELPLHPCDAKLPANEDGWAPRACACGSPPAFSQRALSL